MPGLKSHKTKKKSGTSQQPIMLDNVKSSGIQQDGKGAPNLNFGAPPIVANKMKLRSHAAAIPEVKNYFEPDSDCDDDLEGLRSSDYSLDEPEYTGFKGKTPPPFGSTDSNLTLGFSRNQTGSTKKR